MIKGPATEANDLITVQPIPDEGMCFVYLGKDYLNSECHANKLIVKVLIYP